MDESPTKSIPLCEFTWPPRPGQAGEPGYDEWLATQVRQTIEEGKRDPDCYFAADGVWKELGIED